jgi:hypothetical protein
MQSGGSLPGRGYLRADEAIQSYKEDWLGRRPLAEDIAEQVMRGPRDLGFVVGVVGEWGTGKTSILNMVTEYVTANSDAVVLAFDPWLFAGTDELVARFLHELGSQLREAGGGSGRESVARVGNAVLGYAEALEPMGWVPVIGPWAARAGVVAKAVTAARGTGRGEQSVRARRNEVRRALQELDRQVLVTVDDLDRLEPEQVRDVMRLVRLVGNFPNTTYLLAYSRRAVEAALAGEGEGALYLEKIVQASHNVPDVNPRLLLRAFANELGAAISEVACGPFDRERWASILLEGVMPFLTTVRATTRLLNVVPTTLRLVGGRVNLVDTIALETLRLFAPAAWDRLPAAVGVLTGEHVNVDPLARRQLEREAMQEICVAEPRHTDAVTAIMRALFPRVASLLDDRWPEEPPEAPSTLRVSDGDILRVYLRRQFDEGAVSAALVRKAAGYADDRSAIVELLQSLEPLRAEATIIGIGEADAEFSPHETAILVRVILEQALRMSASYKSPFDLPPFDQVIRVAVELVGRIEDPVARWNVIATACRGGPLSARLHFNEALRERRGGGRLLSPDGETELQSELAVAVEATETSLLLTEPDLFGLLKCVVDMRGVQGESHIRARFHETPLILSHLIERPAAKDASAAARAAWKDEEWSTIIRWFGKERVISYLDESLRGRGEGDARRLQVLTMLREAA